MKTCKNCRYSEQIEILKNGDYRDTVTKTYCKALKQVVGNMNADNLECFEESK